MKLSEWFYAGGRILGALFGGSGLSASTSMLVFLTEVTLSLLLIVESAERLRGEARLLALFLSSDFKEIHRHGFG